MMHLFNFFAGPAACAPRSFFGIQSWDKYLHSAGYVSYNPNSKACEFNVQLLSGGKLDLTTVLLIGLGILDILLRLAAVVAVGFVVYGGVQYITSQGEPDRAKKALGTIINALVGLAIAVLSVSIVAFIGNRIGA